MSNVVDYAFNPHPSNGALHGAHVVAVGRYVSESTINDHNGKNLVPSENDSLKKDGIAVVLFAEEGAQDMLGGKSVGKQRAQHFKAVVDALKRPDAVMVCTADFDATPAQQSPINAYLEGAISVMGADQVALYGGYYPVSRALSAGVVKNAVQTFAWSRFSAAHAAGDGFHVALGNEVFFNLNGNPYTLETQHDQDPTHTGQLLPPEEAMGAVSALPAHAVLVSHVAGRTLPGTFLYDNRAGLRQGLIGTLDGASVDFDESALADFCQHPRPSTTKPETYREWLTQGGSSLEDVAQAVHQPAATILRQTVLKYGKFDTQIYDYLNGLADGSVKPTDKITSGGRLWVKVSE